MQILVALQGLTNQNNNWYDDDADKALLPLLHMPSQPGGGLLAEDWLA